MTMKKKILILLVSIFSIISCAQNLNYMERKKINDVMSLVESVYYGDNQDEINHQSMFEGAVKGILNSLNDPYSEYYTEDEYKSIKDGLNTDFVGIGITMIKEVNKPLQIESTFVGGPAFKAGLTRGDKIFEVDGKDILPLKSNEVTKRIKGVEGVPVTLTVLRNGKVDKEKITLIREKINIQDVDYKMLDNNIGYVSLLEFDDGTGKQVENAIKTLQKQGMKKLIFDLRSNPGGSLQDAIYIASLFVKDKLIVSVKNNRGQVQNHYRTAKYLGDFPLVVLVNGASASASEVVSSVIRDYNRGILIGEKTFGKGIVQTIIPLGDGTAVKITTAKYTTPKNENIHKNGLKPDYNIPMNQLLTVKSYANLTEEDKKVEKENLYKVLEKIYGKEEASKIIEKGDVQLNAAIDFLNGKKIVSVSEETEENK